MIPTKGDRHTVNIRTGYRLAQNRPHDCRHVCVCGDCNGHTSAHPGTVERVIPYADNSVEINVRCDDGRVRRAMVVAPHGDRC